MQLLNVSFANEFLREKISLPIVALLLFWTCGLNAQSSAKKKITITYNSAYCGGAKPPKELIDNLNIPKPLANCKIKLVSMDSSKKIKAKIFKTDKNGAKLLKISEGTYKVFIYSNAKNKAELPFNKKCVKYSETALGEIEINGKESIALIRIPCDPCDPDIKHRP
jgi:hypothetical protein